MNQTEPTMNDLPELPFEKALSYLSLEDLLKSRAVSRRWRDTINNFRVKCLCYSPHPIGFITEKSRWVSGAFLQNFIFPARFSFRKNEWNSGAFVRSYLHSIQFPLFINAYSPTILSNLKHLRLCDLNLNSETLHTFVRLEKLDLIRAKYNGRAFNLDLPMLNSILFDGVHGFEVILGAPRLVEVKLQDSSGLRLDLVHAESVEKLIIEDLDNMEVKKLKNLNQLHIGPRSEIDSTLLSSLKHLTEVYLNTSKEVSNLFEQKQRYGRADLKIYLCGLLLNGPDDPAMSSFEAFFHCSIENPLRQADEKPLFACFYYLLIESVVAKSEINFFKKFTDLCSIIVNQPIQNTQLFLGLLKNLENIVVLRFQWAQPQDLFDRLPEHCAVQVLLIDVALSDLQFLFRLKHLIRLSLYQSIDAEFIRNVYDELPFLSHFDFFCNNRDVRIESCHSKGFKAALVAEKWTPYPLGLNSAIQWIIENTAL